jgi:predicted RNA-binding protein with PIN domain
MLWIIDGYNLMHCWQPMPRTASAQEFQRRRNELIDWLIRKHLRYHPDEDAEVVFDALWAPQPTADQHYHRLRVCFTYQHHADHWIEERLRQVASAQTTVVSNDHGVQRAAQRRNCRWMACETFLEYWDGAKSSGNGDSSGRCGAENSAEEKPTFHQAAEAELLRAFEQPTAASPRRRRIGRRRRRQH